MSPDRRRRLDEDRPGLPIFAQVHKLPIKPRPSLRIDLALYGCADVAFASEPNLERDPLLGPTSQSIADITAINNQIGAVIRDAAHENVNMGIVSVPVIDRYPVEFGAQILGHVGHQVPREAPQILHVTRIFGANDEAEMMAIILAPIGKAVAITRVATGIEHRCIATVAGHAVAFEIRDVPTEWCGPVLRSFVPDYASENRHSPMHGRAQPHSGECVPAPTASAGALSGPRAISAQPRLA